eukprot:CAMPEP_0172358452 /NCGR_PEP_ID=MMETSP1060-20121228/2762_1 /TAXON_ID=37318 /ORGANISM="Pseudo-nitzschia pungens, Strain cf. cingulata" /LENGTH=390 /DNA_ID=CAMNT_0013079663 /DNA_START=151 /DNA_END=1323 /DNA_ORIENTATION=+
MRNLPVTSCLSFFPPPSNTNADRSSSTLSGDASASETTIKNVITVEGRASVTAMGSKEFLLSNPSGAYTTARTSGGGRSIFEWEAHVERTALSLASMMETDGDNDNNNSSNNNNNAFERGCRLTDPAVLRQKLDASVEEAVRLHTEVNNNNKNKNGCSSSSATELKITALVGWKKRIATNGGSSKHNNNPDPKSDYEEWISCHVTSLPSLPTPPVRVEVRGSPRENAAAKNSAWVSDRAPLEALMAEAEVAPINELLLTNANDEILEGSQTNFYAIIDGALHTAGEGILEGTVRRLVLDVCRAEGIPIVLRPPSLREVESWQGALLSSTSRLALPIDELYIPTEGKPSGKGDLKVAFSTDGDSMVARIRELVSREVEARSTPIGQAAVPF